jgi:hypothetical protein
VTGCINTPSKIVMNSSAMVKVIFLPIYQFSARHWKNLPGWICVWNSLLDWGTSQIIVCVGYRDEVVIQKSCCTQSESMQLFILTC